jgi:hypothetical protein
MNSKAKSNQPIQNISAARLLGQQEDETATALPGPLTTALAEAEGVLKRTDAFARALLDKLAAAAGLIAALVQARDLDSRHLALSRVRPGMRAEMAGVYLVVKAFRIFESNYAPGQLVDRSVMGGDGMVYRYWIARSLQALEGAIAA